MLKLLDLFSGIGGFSLGLERTGGFETVAFCEIEPYCQKVLAQHWPDVRIYDDVQTLTKERLDADGIGVDAICGGFPCQDISTAGRQAGIEAERSGLWSDFARLIGDLRPQVVFVENVSNLLSGPSEQRGGWFGKVLGDLATLGYDAEWHSISASSLGACHKRQRVWITAYPSSERNKRLQHQLEKSGGSRQGRKGHEENSIRPSPDTECIRPQGQRGAEEPCYSKALRDRQTDLSEHVLGWPTVPAVRRADDGVPRGMDRNRLKALGNAVVPQIPELLGRAWLKSTQEPFRESR